MRIKKAACNYESEALLSPFGFKGSSLTKLWQTAVYLESEKNFAVGLGVQSVLWSDASIFAEYGEEKGNELMFNITKYALEKTENKDFDTPMELIDELFPIALEYGKKITNNQRIRATFALNALVPIDLAAWSLYAKEKGISDFDNLIPDKSGLDYHHSKLANIPLVTYNCPLESVVRMAESGICLFKIKIGSDPCKDGNLDEMVAWDKKRILELHKTLKNYSTPYTKSGKLLYYLDANGRYDSKGRLMQLLDFAKEIGAMDRIILLEEPFDENNKTDVRDIPVCIAADESAHQLDDVKERISLGYRAITLKSIAKTLSMTMKILNYADSCGIDCFCADLTVNPCMVEWNKNVAARIKPLPDMKIGVVESNGAQNYQNWEEMLSYHPLCGANFINSKNGVYNLDEAFYKTNGGIFITSSHYLEMFGKKG